MTHIVLVGDSIFDNSPYVADGEAVIEQLSTRLAPNEQATMLARDGDVTLDVIDQLDSLPASTTHLFISCGGNDALQIRGDMLESVTDIREAMDYFSELREEFRLNYTKMLFACQQKVEKVCVCTVYDCVPEIEESELTALAFFNEIILRSAAQVGIPVIDLRLVCEEPTDYSTISTIEPSATGAEKIIEKLLEVARHHDFSRRQTLIYT